MKRSLIAAIALCGIWTGLRAATPDLDGLKRAAIQKVDDRRVLTQQIVDSL